MHVIFLFVLHRVNQKKLTRSLKWCLIYKYSLCLINLVRVSVHVGLVPTGRSQTNFGSPFSPPPMCASGIKRLVIERLSPEMSFERYDFFETIGCNFFQ